MVKLMKIIKDVPRDLWQKVADRCPWATFFHTPDWAEVISSVYQQYRIVTKGFCFDNGNIVIFPLLVRKWKPMGITKRYISMWPGVYGGPISENPINDSQLKEIIRNICGFLTYNVEVNPTPFFQYELTGFKKMERTTNIIALEQSLNGIWSGFSKGHKSSIRKAERSDISIESANNVDDWVVYYKIYQDRLQRWGKEAGTNYSWNLFQRLHDVKEKNGNVQLWLGKKEKEAICGAIILYHKKHVSYWHAASLQEADEVVANNLLQWYIMNDAKQNGYIHYDMLPSRRESVMSFKKHFGANSFPATIWRWSNPIVRQIRSVKDVRFLIGVG